MGNSSDPSEQKCTFNYSTRKINRIPLPSPFDDETQTVLIIDARFSLFRSIIFNSNIIGDLLRLDNK